MPLYMRYYAICRIDMLRCFPPPIRVVDVLSSAYYHAHQYHCHYNAYYAAAMPCARCARALIAALDGDFAAKILCDVAMSVVMMLLIVNNATKALRGYGALMPP